MHQRNQKEVITITYVKSIIYRRNSIQYFNWVSRFVVKNRFKHSIQSNTINIINQNLRISKYLYQDKNAPHCCGSNKDDKHFSSFFSVPT